MKIAVQFFGHLRTFMDCYNSINENLLNRYDADVFFYTWDRLDHNTKTWHQFHLANNNPLDPSLTLEIPLNNSSKLLSLANVSLNQLKESPAERVTPIE